jgi:hypothetical protein
MHKNDADHMPVRGDKDIRLLELLHIASIVRGKHSCNNGMNRHLLPILFSIGPSGVRLVRLLHGFTDIPHVILRHG